MLSHVSRLNRRWALRALCTSSCCIHSRMIPLAFSQLITVVTVGWVWKNVSERMKKKKLQNSSYCSALWHLPCLKARSAVSHQTLMLQQYRVDADPVAARSACKEKKKQRGTTKNLDFLFLDSFHVMWLSDSTTNANLCDNATKYNLTRHLDRFQIQILTDPS